MARAGYASRAHWIFLYILDNDANMFLKRLKSLLVIKLSKQMYSEYKQSVIQFNHVLLVLHYIYWLYA